MEEQEIVYQDEFISVRKGLFEYDGKSLLDNDLRNKLHLYTNTKKVLTRYWLYNSDGSILYFHDDSGEKCGYEFISSPKEGIVRLKFSDGEWYFMTVFGHLLKSYPFIHSRLLRIFRMELRLFLLAEGGIVLLVVMDVCF